MNPNSEIRGTEIRKKTETRRPNAAPVSGRASGFGFLSELEFRTSDLSTSNCKFSRHFQAGLLATLLLAVTSTAPGRERRRLVARPRQAASFRRQQPTQARHCRCDRGSDEAGIGFTKMKTAWCLLTGFLSLTANTFSQDTNFWIFLCFGQSNMEGFPGIDEPDTTGHNASAAPSACSTA